MRRAREIDLKGGREEFSPRKRSWPASLLWAVLVVGAGIILSATINPVFDRSVHWDWMAGLAPSVFVLLTLSLRLRWV